MIYKQFLRQLHSFLWCLDIITNPFVSIVLTKELLIIINNYSYNETVHEYNIYFSTVNENM